jgi:sulfatase modifying factor 1
LRSALGTGIAIFTQELYGEAKEDGWTVLSMKNDWKRILRSRTKDLVAAAVCVAASVTIGSFALAQKHGSCTDYSGLPADDNDTAGMVFITGGTFVMGSERHRPEERFTHVVRVDGFWIDRHEVTNAQFREFVAATGYLTLAERGIDPESHPGMPRELLAPGSMTFVKPTDVAGGGRITQWFQYVAGANWRAPTGPGSSIEGKDNHPVVHIAYEDALAYAHWRGRELPTEAQWEFAARGGRDGEDDWSSAFGPDGKPIANTWQGIFPLYANVILTAVGHNLRLVLAWLRALCRLIVLALLPAFATRPALKSAS